MRPVVVTQKPSQSDLPVGQCPAAWLVDLRVAQSMARIFSTVFVAVFCAGKADFA